MIPVRVSNRPIRFPRWTVNQITPCPSITRVCGSPPDGAVAVPGVPDLAFSIYEQAVRLRPRWKIPLGEMLGARVEARDLVPGHHCDVDIAVAGRRRITREPGRGHRPFRDLAFDCLLCARRDRVVGPPGPHGPGRHGDQTTDDNGLQITLHVRHLPPVSPSPSIARIRLEPQPIEQPKSPTRLAYAPERGKRTAALTHGSGSRD